MAAHAGTKAVIAALIGNAAIAIAKFAGFFVTGASSMLAEAIHSVADSGNQALLLWGNKAASRAPDDEHQFGYGRERYFWAFVVALVLFLLGSVFAIYEGVSKIRHPEEIENLFVAYGILGFAVIAESLSFRTAVREARPLKGDLGWWQFIKRSRSPELPVVLMEDLGALLGLLVALAALSMAKITDEPVWDGIGTLTIGILLFFIAVTLMVEMRSLLIGEGAGPREMLAIRQAIAGTPGVERVIHIRTDYLGPDELLVGAKVAFDQHLDVAGLAAAVDRVEDAVRAVVPHARPMYVEPDLHRTEGSSGAPPD